MDELTLLRRLDADAPAPTREALSHAFDALDARMAAAERCGRPHVPVRRRRAVRVRRALVGAACVATLVTGLVLTDTVGIAGLRPGATAQAAEVLESAAVETIRTADPVVGRGQYLRLRTVHRSMSTGGTQDRPLRWLREGTDTTYIPFDRDDEWTLVRTVERPVEFFSAAAKIEALKSFAEAEPRYDGRDELLRARQGDFYGSPADEAGFDGLPRDPRVLLNRIYRITLGQGTTPDGSALDWIATQLRSGVVPADLRASLYRAAALIPGVALTESDAVLDGRTGVAIGRVDARTGVRTELVIDPETGLLIGEREIATREGYGVPAGTVVGSTAVTTTVVADAPQGAEHRVQ